MWFLSVSVDLVSFIQLFKVNQYKTNIKSFWHKSVKQTNYFWMICVDDNH